jgi:hypothetical protein
MGMLWNITMTSLLGMIAAHGASNPLVSLPHRMSSPRMNSAVTFAKKYPKPYHAPLQ